MNRIIVLSILCALLAVLLINPSCMRTEEREGVDIPGVPEPTQQEVEPQEPSPGGEDIEQPVGDTGQDP